MYGCESWTIKTAGCWRIDAFELLCWRRLLRVLWIARKSNPVNPKGKQSWIFIGRTDAEAEAPTLWTSDAKNQLSGKDPDAGKDWRQEEKGRQRLRWLDGITDSMDMSFEQILGDREGQGSLACCSPWGHKESDTTQQLNSSVQFIHSVVSDSLQPHEPQHASPPCLSPNPRAYRVGDAIQPSHPLLSPSPPALNLFQHQGLFQWVSSSHQVAKVLEFQLQQQSFQWTPRTDLL